MGEEARGSLESLPLIVAITSCEGGIHFIWYTDDVNMFMQVMGQGSCS